MSKLTTFLLKEQTLVFGFCLAMLFGICWQTMIYFDIAHSVDPKEYWNLAQFNLDQHPIRRYRVIVPFLAAGINYIIIHLKNLFGSSAMTGEFSLRFSFFVVNILFTGLWCTGIYIFCRAYNTSRVAAIVATSLVLASKATIYMAAIPIIESLHCFILIITLIGIKQKRNELIYLAILLGPFTKESFLFVAPVIFFFSSVPKLKQVVLFIISGALVFGFRYLLDNIAGNNTSEGLQTDLQFFPEIGDKLKHLITLASINDLVATYGFMLLMPIAGMIIIKNYFSFIFSRIEGFAWAYLAAVAFMVIINGDMPRMLYLAMPVVALTVAFTLDELRGRMIPHSSRSL